MSEAAAEEAPADAGAALEAELDAAAAALAAAPADGSGGADLVSALFLPDEDGTLRPAAEMTTGSTGLPRMEKTLEARCTTSIPDTTRPKATE